MRRRRATSEWRAILEEYRKSVETQKEFCQERGLSVSSLQNHLHAKTLHRDSINVAGYGGRSVKVNGRPKLQRMMQPQRVPAEIKRHVHHRQKAFVVSNQASISDLQSHVARDPPRAEGLALFIAQAEGLGRRERRTRPSHSMVDRSNAKGAIVTCLPRGLRFPPASVPV